MTAPMTAPAPPTNKHDALEKEILEACGFEAEDLVDLPGQVKSIDWSGSPSWAKKKSIPGDPNKVIYGIFGTASDDKRIQHVEYVLGDMRVYAYPLQSLPGESYARFTLNRASPGIVHEELSRDAFVAEIARELEELVELDGSMDEECPTCEAPDVPTGSKFCNSCGAAMPEEEEDPEEPEEPEEPEPKPAAVT